MTKVFILNGWAASEEAWSLCTFHRDRILSYRDHLSGETDRAFDLAESVVLVGWSMGGSYALKLAARAPEKVAGMVLVAATPRMMACDGWVGMTERRLAALEMGLRMTQGGGFFGVSEGLPNPYVCDTEENLAKGIDYLRSTDLRGEIAARADELANIPAFIFQSERDPIVRSANAQYLKGVFPSAAVKIVPGAEHALSIFIPLEIDSAVASLTA